MKHFFTIVIHMMCFIKCTSQSFQQRLGASHVIEDPRNEVIMPMHRRFVLEQQQQYNNNSPSQPDTMESFETSRKTDQKFHYYNPLDRALDVLSSSWWVRLTVDRNREPATRRSHAASVYAISREGSGSESESEPEPEPEPESTSRNGGEPENKEASNFGVDPTANPAPDGPDLEPPQKDVSSPSQPEPVPLPADSKEDNTPRGPADNEPIAPDEPKPQSNMIGDNDNNSNSAEAPIDKTSSVTVTTEPSADLPHSPEEGAEADSNTSFTPGQRDLSTASLQEFMIITGGFTDEDWHTFPVWAYDMTSATEHNEGRWYELTPPPVNDEACMLNVTKAGVENALPCAPASRVGHISVVRGDSLYVFGGLEYDQHKGVFIMDDEPYMYSMLLSEDEFGGRDNENYNENFDPHATKTEMLYWKKWLPQVVDPGDKQSTQTEDLDFTINRGEVRGAYWEKGDKLIVYGGLHVSHYDTNTGHTRQRDTTLGDVWAYDFKTDTWEMMASTLEDYGSHPGERTSHAATVIGDELIVYGGLRKVETNVWDGSTVWSQLDDVWMFDLNTGSWKLRPMTEYVGRAYHAVVGWSIGASNSDEAILASFGGFKTMMDPVDNQQISYVYDDTMVSNMPQMNNVTLPSEWYLATYRGLQPDTISTRLEHSAVLSKEFGNMIIWGGRYRQTSDIGGVWSLNIAGEDSTVQYIPRSQDPENQSGGMTFVLLVMVMMMSMMFTYMCGVVHQRLEGETLANADQTNAEPTPGNSIFGRNGLGQDIIDTLPVKKYQNESAVDGDNRNTTEHDAIDFSFDDDENCCAICLVEYEVGDDIRCLPCNHEFHKSCVDAWLGNNASCPACRHSLSDLVPLTTSSTLAAQIRATISTRMRPGAAAESTQQNPVQRHPSSPPSTPDEAIAPGIRRFQNLRRLFHARHRIERTRSRGDSEDDNEEIGDLELSYSSSLELSDGNSSNDSSFDSDDVPVEDRSRRGRRNLNTGRQRLMNGRGQRRRRQRRARGGQPSPLNAPLQPSDASVV